MEIITTAVIQVIQLVQEEFGAIQLTLKLGSNNAIRYTMLSNGSKSDKGISAMDFIILVDL